MQLLVAVVVLREADVSSSIQTLKSTSSAQVGLVLLGLKARGKLGARSLVAVHCGTHSLNLVWVGSYPLPAEGDLVFALRSPEGKTSCKFGRRGAVTQRLGHMSGSSFSGNGA